MDKGCKSIRESLLKEDKDNENKAIAIGKNRKALLKKLTDTKSVLDSDLKKGFGIGEFDFENKTLTGDNGIVLYWQVRKYPDEPESYRNQQTNIGFVGVRQNKLLGEKS